MFFNHLLLPTLILGFACYWVGRRSVIGACDDSARRRRLCLLALLSLPGFSFILYYAHVIREPAWYVEFRSIPGAEMLTALSGLLFGALEIPNPLAGKWRYVIGSGTMFRLSILAVFIPFAKPILLPLSGAGLNDAWKEGVCLQSTPATCGPCSLATIFKSLGLEATEREIARAAFSGRTGTENWYLIRYARRQGLEARIGYKTDLKAVKPPAILGVKLEGGAGHFITYLGDQDRRRIIGDPLSGRFLLTDEVFHRLYDFSGMAMEFKTKGPQAGPVQMQNRPTKAASPPNRTPAAAAPSP